jgi:type II secretory pathway pseudopilin PulG|tara:strand:+ start:85 stop:561 length:477 start_codon:yes stop_codon:yes gene_type:complete
MIFGQLRMIITLLMIAGIAGAGVYVFKLRSDNAVLKANQIQLEQSIEKQQQLLQKQKEDFEDILESNKQLNKLVNILKKDMEDLDKRFNKGKRDIGNIGVEKPKVLERIINKGADNAARCIELASGAEHTEQELKATKKSEINPECPALANPSYVPYE